MENTKENTPLGLLAEYTNANDENLIQKLKFVENFDMARERVTVLKDPRAQLDEYMIYSAELEFKRFFCLELLYPNSGTFSPTPPVDAVWHELIIDTRRYAQLCEEVYGRFIHHIPLSPQQVAKSSGNSLGHTKSCLTKAFGGAPPTIWGGSPNCDMDGGSCMKSCESA